MKNNSFERIMLVLILVTLVYAVFLLSKKPDIKPAGHFEYLPHSQQLSAKTASDTTPTEPRGPKGFADTLLIYSEPSGVQKVNKDCPCCPQAYILYSSDSTSDPRGPHFYKMVALSSDSTPGTKGPKLTEPNQ